MRVRQTLTAHILVLPFAPPPPPSESSLKKALQQRTAVSPMSGNPTCNSRLYRYVTRTNVPFFDH